MFLFFWWGQQNIFLPCLFSLVRKFKPVDFKGQTQTDVFKALLWSDCVESPGGGAGASLAREALVLWRQAVCRRLHRPGAPRRVEGWQRNRHEDSGIHTHFFYVTHNLGLHLLWFYGSFSPSSQYPGVSDSIHSDINNLISVLKMSVAIPEGKDSISICFTVSTLKTCVQWNTNCRTLD